MIIGPQIPDEDMPSIEELNKMKSSESYIFTGGQYGETVVGESLPEDTEEMLQDILSLISAQKVREDPETDIWKGMYDDTEVYVQMYTHSYKNYDHEGVQTDEYTVHAGRILGEIAGAFSTDEFYFEDRKLIEESGLNIEELRSLGLGHNALRGYIENIREINEGNE